MLKGIDIRQRIEFVSKLDDSDPKTIFMFRPLTGMEMMNIFSSGTDSNNKMVEALTLSIVEIKNGEGEKDEFIKSLPIEVLNELYENFNIINKITGKDEKNS